MSRDAARSPTVDGPQVGGPEVGGLRPNDVTAVRPGEGVER